MVSPAAGRCSCNGIDASADGAQVFVAEYEGTRVWDVATGDCVRMLVNHKRCKAVSGWACGTRGAQTWRRYMIASVDVVDMDSDTF
jgi:hypothetical protein